MIHPGFLLIFVRRKTYMWLQIEGGGTRYRCTREYTPSCICTYCTNHTTVCRCWVHARYFKIWKHFFIWVHTYTYIMVVTDVVSLKIKSTRRHSIKKDTIANSNSNKKWNTARDKQNKLYKHLVVYTTCTTYMYHVYTIHVWYTHTTHTGIGYLQVHECRRYYVLHVYM